ncbi:MAG: SH3 domain-containing protein [Rickettsiales bacterium]|nr:SH3 domain-containing protein [Rickettsiales bacterium]
MGNFFFILLLGLSFPVMAAGVNNSGLPVPRWVSLRSEEVNVRTGPGTRYPIQWVYRRDGMPVEVIEEFDLWRKIRDSDGTSGWVHKGMVQSKRNIMIKSKDAQIMRSEPKEKARPILKAEPTVIGQLMECNEEWCRVQISGHKGWLEKKVLWGVYKADMFD